MDIKEYVEHFDKIFNTNLVNKLDINNKPLLKNAFEELGEYIYSESKEKIRISKELREKQKELIQNFDKNQMKRFYEYEELQEESLAELEQQVLVFGYLLATEEFKELNIKK